MGYATQDDADKHAKTVHHYHDELEFCLRSLRDALNLDVLGNPKLKAEANNVAGNGLATKGTTAGNPERVNTQRSNEPSQDLSAPLVVQPGETLTQAIQRHETSQHTGSSTPILQKQPHDPWQNSNITRSTLLNLFSDIPDFPQYRSDPTSAFTIAFPEERWPDNAPGRTIQEISEGVRLAQADKEANTAPEDVIHVRLEDYNPWPDSNGGVDPYEGKIVNIIKDERPHEWSMDYDKLESEWCDPENIWRQVGERLAWERANPPWYEDLGNEDIRAFMEGRLRDIGKDQKGGEKMEEEKEEEEEAMVEDSGIGGEDEAKEESPTKRVKVSP